ncbi:hypothetical protein [Nostoc sp.]|uniref:hypothetical protein n=1 Tax=Nostoc sp. TaxID=1180 RepID=UPI002FFBCA2E
MVFLRELIEPDRIFVVIYCTYPLVELAAAYGYSKSEVNVQWGKLRYLRRAFLRNGARSLTQFLVDCKSQQPPENEFPGS